MATHRLILALVLAAPLITAQSTPPPNQSTQDSSPDSLRAIHDALFSSFLPIDELKGTPQTSDLFAETRDSIWASASGVREFREMLAPLPTCAALALPVALPVS